MRLNGRPNFFSLSLTEMQEDKIRQASGLVLNNTQIQSAINAKNKENDKLLIYIIPEEWSISELGVENRNLNPMANVQAHGNPKEKNPDIKSRFSSDLYNIIKFINSAFYCLFPLKLL